jgi:hemerythrin-like domain-containing protein
MTASLSRLHEEHETLWKGIESLKETADLIELAPPEALLIELEEDHIFLFRHLLPHAEAEENVLYRAYDQLANSPWATETMRRDHAAILAFADELTAVQLQLSMDAATPEQKQELRRILYGLYALLKIHFAKEEELLLPRLEEALSQEAADQLLDSMEAATQKNEVRAGW